MHQRRSPAAWSARSRRSQYCRSHDFGVSLRSSSRSTPAPEKESRPDGRGATSLKHPGAAFVIKYFDLIDEFIKVRCCSDELLQELHAVPDHQQVDYRSASCAPACRRSTPTCCAAVKRLDDGYDLEIVEELLYQICIDVNPSLEIHQVSIPIAERPEGPSDGRRHRSCRARATTAPARACSAGSPTSSAPAPADHRPGRGDHLAGPRRQEGRRRPEAPDPPGRHLPARRPHRHRQDRAGQGAGAQPVRRPAGDDPRRLQRVRAAARVRQADRLAARLHRPQRRWLPHRGDQEEAQQRRAVRRGREGALQGAQPAAAAARRRHHHRQQGPDGLVPPGDDPHDEQPRHREDRRRAHAHGLLGGAPPPEPPGRRPAQRSRSRR
jgi:hypothetical protein